MRSDLRKRTRCHGAQPPVFRLAIVLGLSAPIVCAADSADVRRLMAPEEFRAAGLEKLDAEELEALNRWLVRYTAREAPVVRASSESVREELHREGEEVIHSHLAAESAGAGGRAVFRLENGQVWRQRRDETYHYREKNPAVEIRKNLLGFWVLRFMDSGQSVGVKRIE